VVEIVEGLRRSDIMVVLSGCLCGLKDTLSDSDMGMCYYCTISIDSAVTCHRPSGFGRNFSVVSCHRLLWASDRVPEH